jgi:hypothetical protein
VVASTLAQPEDWNSNYPETTSALVINSAVT